MTITFVTNLVHHQLPLADELYMIPGVEYHYLACEPLPDCLIKGGYDPTLECPYIILAYESEEKNDEAQKIINDSNVVFIGTVPKDWVLQWKKDNEVIFH